MKKGVIMAFLAGALSLAGSRAADAAPSMDGSPVDIATRELKVPPTTPHSVESCKVGAFVTSIHRVDPPSGTFGADMWLWSVCATPKRKPLDTMEFFNAQKAVKSLPSQNPRTEGYGRKSRSPANSEAIMICGTIRLIVTS
jgi:hypothetical protein